MSAYTLTRGEQVAALTAERYSGQWWERRLSEQEHVAAAARRLILEWNTKEAA